MYSFKCQTTQLPVILVTFRMNYLPLCDVGIPNIVSHGELLYCIQIM
jgi:hypothetical protein